MDVNHIILDAQVVLEKKGIEVDSPLILDILSGAGCKIHEETRKGHPVKAARISPELIEKSLESAPKLIPLYTTDGKLASNLRAGTFHFSIGSCGRIFWDLSTGNHRSTSADLAKFIRVADYLEHINIVSTAMVPHDIEPDMQDAHRLLTVFQYSQKPVVTGIFPKAGASNFERMKDMLLVFRGSERELKEKPLAIFDCCPDPLKWSKFLGESIIECGRYGIPVEIISMPQPGLSYPATLYESVAQSVAETFAGFVISQTANPGAPIIWGGSASSINFEKGRTDAELASPAVVKLFTAYAAVARKYELPSHAYAIADSSTIDAQYGIDKQRAVSRAMLAGINHITGLGMYGEEDILSCEALVIDNDVVGAELNIQRGIGRNRPNTLEDISFLADEGVIHPETATLLRSGEYFRPRTFDRDRTRPMLERAIEAVKEILATHQPEYLSAEQIRSLKSCLSGILLLLAGLLLVMTGCSTTGYQRIGNGTAHELPCAGPSSSPQREPVCGPQAVAQVFRFWGIEADEQALMSYALREENDGARLGVLRTWTREHGLNAQLYHGSPQDLAEKVAAGMPVIAVLDVNRYPKLPHPLIQKNFWGHAVVVTGFNDESREVILCGGADPPRMPYNAFFREWQAADWVTLLLWPVELASTKQNPDSEITDPIPQP